jgi:hypothetical protein
MGFNAMTRDAELALRAVLVRAATVEAARQAAIQRGDDVAREGHERELQHLWHQHQQLEAVVA